MMDRERRLTEENAVFKEPEEAQTGRVGTTVNQTGSTVPAPPRADISPREDEDVDETTAGGLHYPDEKEPAR